jgi:hypothetical protein
MTRIEITGMERVTVDSVCTENICARIIETALSLYFI